MKGYKAFKKGMICKGKQYAENTEYEEKGADACCKAGVMHYCETPFDVWDYYPVIDDNGDFTEYAEVEPLAEVLTEDNKRATRKLRIGAKLSFKDFIKTAVSVAVESVEPAKDKEAEKLHGFGVWYLSDNGDYTQIGSSGYGKQISSGGYGVKIGSNGKYTRIGSSGWNVKICSSGYGAQIGSSGDGVQIGSSGHGAQISSSGDDAQIGSVGDIVQIGSSGDYTQIGSSGDRSKISSSGKWVRISLNGSNSVGAAIGIDSIAKGAVGNWIVLAEWNKREDATWFPACVKAAQIDGETLKPDTWYKLENGEFVEVQND